MKLPKSKLTDREKEVGVLLIQGYSNWRMAKILTLSGTTIKNHLTAIYLKLDISRKSGWSPRCRAAYLLRRAQVAHLLTNPTLLVEALVSLQQEDSNG